MMSDTSHGIDQLTEAEVNLDGLPWFSVLIKELYPYECCIPLLFILGGRINERPAKLGQRHIEADKTLQERRRP